MLFFCKQHCKVKDDLYFRGLALAFRTTLMHVCMLLLGWIEINEFQPQFPKLNSFTSAFEMCVCAAWHLQFSANSPTPRSALLEWSKALCWGELSRAGSCLPLAPWPPCWPRGAGFSPACFSESLQVTCPESLQGLRAHHLGSSLG